MMSNNRLISIEEAEKNNPFKAFKFWASKPLEYALMYLDQYAGGKNVLIDPFAGSGVFVFVALLRGKKAIYNDLSPYALFLARSVMKPLDPERLHDLYKEVLDRPIDRDIKTRDTGEVVIKKGTRVIDVIKWLYETRCNECERSGRVTPIIADYYVWDTIYYGLKNEIDELARKDDRLRALRDVFELGKMKIGDKELEIYTVSRSKVNEKWEDIFNKAPEAWTSGGKVGKKPGLVSTYFGELVRRQVLKRYKREPRYKRVECREHGDELQGLNDYDKQKIILIERLEYPYPEYIPEATLEYRRIESGVEKRVDFHQLRRQSVLVCEAMSTIEDEVWEKLEKGESVPVKLKYFFTKRNLIALQVLLWSINNINDPDERDQVYLILASKLHMLAKFDRMGNYGRWASGYYQALDDFKENNPLTQYTEGWQEVKKAKEWIWKIYKEGLYKLEETFNVREFLNTLNQPEGKNVLWLKVDAKKIGNVIERKVVDIVFTDPPYKGAEEANQYYELSYYYTQILGLDFQWRSRYDATEWWSDEIIVNPKQGKDLDKYYRDLEAALKSLDKIVKDSAVWIITYHSPNKDVWEYVRKALLSIGLIPPTFDKIKVNPIRKRGKGTFFVERYGSIGRDAYIVLYKQVGKTKPSRRISTKEFLEKTFTALKERIKENHGFISWDDFAAVYPDIVLKYGGPFDTREDYKELFLKSTFGLDEDFRILDRDLIGEDLYKEIYKDIDVKSLLKEFLKHYAEKNNGVISRDIVELVILAKIDTNISEKDKNAILSELFDYDPISNVYRIKKSKHIPILTFSKGKLKGKPKPQYMPLPYELASSIIEAARYYGGHKVKHAYKRSGDEVVKISDVIVEVNGTVYYIIINDPKTAIKLLNKISGQVGVDREKTVVLYIYYGSVPEDVKSYRDSIRPAKMLVVPYEKYECAIDAFKSYNPCEVLIVKCKAEEL